MRLVSFWIVCLSLLAALGGFIKLDSITGALLALVSVPFVFPFLKSFKFMGAEFNFKESVVKIEEYTQSSQPQKPTKNKNERVFQVFNLEKSLRLVDEDSALALASLRMDIERALINLSKTDTSINIEKQTLGRIVGTLQKHELLSESQVLALNEIIAVCNQAVHGTNISKRDAKKVIKLTEKLGTTFSFGYMPNMTANPNYEKQGFICEWEHCIELSPFSGVKNLACHIFGHDCPGGVKRQLQCKKEFKS